MGNCLCSTAATGTAAATATATATAATPNPLELATYENTPEFTFNGLRAIIKVLRIIDGDTVDIALPQQGTGQLYRHRVRLYGIDTPEKRPSKADPLRHLEMEASYRAKQALERRLQENDYMVLAHFSHADKYGRLLCTLYDKTGEDLNRWMIAQGHATEYFGKTKKKFEPQPQQPQQTLSATSK